MKTLLEKKGLKTGLSSQGRHRLPEEYRTSEYWRTTNCARLAAFPGRTTGAKRVVC